MDTHNVPPPQCAGIYERLLSIAWLFSDNRVEAGRVLIIFVVSEACTEIVFWLLFFYQVM